MPRTALAMGILVAGIIWSLPIGPGENETAVTSTPIIVQAALSIEARSGNLTIVGHTASSSHEKALRDAAALAFPNHKYDFRFQPLGLVPGWWTAATIVLVRSLASTISPSAQLSRNALRVNALARDPAAIELQLQSIDAELPPSVEKKLRLLDVGPPVRAQALCTRQFDSFAHRPVKFIESGTELRTSAYGVLDRIVALADACRDARISITGHSDSSGDEAYNLGLSLARAQAVAAYLNERGIAAERLFAEGVGSSVPIADNATRYGRSLNRRLEIRFANEN